MLIIPIYFYYIVAELYLLKKLITNPSLLFKFINIIIKVMNNNINFKRKKSNFQIFINL